MKLEDMYDDWLSGNTFVNYLSLPFFTTSFKQAINMNVWLKHGEKTIAPFAEKLLNRFTLTEFNSKMADALEVQFGSKWEHEFKLLELEYSPIENYNMTEKATDNTDCTNKKESTEKTANNLTDTMRETGTVSDSGTNTQTTDMSTENTAENTHSENGSDVTVNDNLKTDRTTYAFNSTTNVPTDSDVVTGGTTLTKTNTLTEQDSGNEKTNGTVTDESSNTRTNNLTTETTKSGNVTITGNEDNTEKTTTTHELKRSGNIGVTTTQQMMQQEVEFWKWNFLDEVVKDIVFVIGLGIYEVD